MIGSSGSVKCLNWKLVFRNSHVVHIRNSLFVSSLLLILSHMDRPSILVMKWGLLYTAQSRLLIYFLIFSSTHLPNSSIPIHALSRSLRRLTHSPATLRTLICDLVKFTVVVASCTLIFSPTRMVGGPSLIVCFTMFSLSSSLSADISPQRPPPGVAASGHA